MHEQRRLERGDIIEIDGIPVVTPELLVLQLAWWKPQAALRRGRDPRAAPEATHLLRVDARDLPATRSTRAAWRCRDADRARMVEPGERRDRERDGNAAVPDVSRARPSRARAAVRDLRPQRAVRRPRRRRAARMEGRRRVPVDAGAPRRVPGRSATTAGATRSWPPATGRSSARIGDLRTGGHELVEEILAVARSDHAELASRSVRLSERY